MSTETQCTCCALHGGPKPAEPSVNERIYGPKPADVIEAERKLDEAIERSDAAYKAAGKARGARFRYLAVSEAQKSYDWRGHEVYPTKVKREIERLIGKEVDAFEAYEAAGKAVGLARRHVEELIQAHRRAVMATWSQTPAQQ